MTLCRINNYKEERQIKMVRYSDELIDEIRNSNDIVDVISQYMSLKRSGRNYFGLCPFHNEKSPSFSVSQDKQIFHCFGCGIGGDVFRFIEKIENIDFREAMQILAERARIVLPTLDNDTEGKKAYIKSKVYEINKIVAEFYHENLYRPTSKTAQEYVKKRKLDNNTLKTFSIGYANNSDELYKMLTQKGFKEEEILASSLVNKSNYGQYYDRFKNRLMIPIKDVRDRVIAFGGRVLDDSKPKYINSPENIVYSKGRQLFGLNVAKKSGEKKIIIVEGYMDAISLYQRGITNVVASLGTALTEHQGRLLRKYADKIIIGYDSDGAGQAATMRGLDILQNLGYDVRVLQMEGAKDPDEYVIKYGSGRFNLIVDQAISLVEFKVKSIKSNLNLDIPNDKIKFLNEVTKILTKVNSEIEREVYIDKICSDYKISREAIYSQINKIIRNNDQTKKALEKPKINRSIIKKQEDNSASEAIIKRENMVISLLISNDINIYEKIKEKIKPEDFKDEKNKDILKKLYEEFEKGNSNINAIISSFTDEEIINHITYIMAYDFEITDVKKAVIDLIQTYEKEKVLSRRNEILKKMENENLEKEELSKLEKELSEIIIKLAKMK